jgi:FkbM family methyltransferase
MRQVHSLLGPLWVHDLDWVGVTIEGQNWWDQQLQPYIDETASADAWAIDIGASIGWFTLYLAEKFAHVISVEAHPQTFEILERNIADRGWQDRVTTILAAAYDREGWAMTLASSAMSGFEVQDDITKIGCPSSILFVPNHFGPGVTQTKILDAIVPPEAPIALIKSDAQGCDLRALRGLRNTILRCRPRILFEWEWGPATWHGDDWADCLRFLEAVGYKPPTQLKAGLGDFVTDPKEKR